MASSTTVLPLAVLLVATACVTGPASYQCATAADCGADGACEPDGHCSVADGACPGGRRYRDSAGALAGVCVGDGDGADASGLPPADAQAPLQALCTPGFQAWSDDPCVAAVCAAQPACCGGSWDQPCVVAAAARCDRPRAQVLAGAGFGSIEAGTLADTTFASRFNSAYNGWSYDIAWGDFDGNGRPDLAVGREGFPGAAGVAIFRGGGLNGVNLVMTPETIEGAPIGTVDGVEWRDFDRDHDLDLLASGDGGVYLIETTPGALIAHVLTTEAARAVWTDTDGAAPWDLMIARRGVPAHGDERLVHHRLSGPPYTLDAVTVAATLSTLPFNDLAWCDVSNDGRRDLLAVQFGPTFTFTATATSFATGAQLPVGGPMIACGDLDDDGANEVVIGSFGGPIHVIRNAGGIGGAVTYTTTASFQTAGLALGDLDGNGRLDIVVSEAQPGDAPLTVLDNVGAPGPTWFSARPGPDWNGPQRDSRAIDLGPLPR